MEAVGEFEKVWSWATENHPNQQSSEVPLTRELSPEYRPEQRHHSSSSKRESSKVLTYAFHTNRKTKLTLFHFSGAKPG